MSDRGSLFTSAFWTEVCYQLKVKRRLSTAFHPQTDGQTERQNQCLEQYLRMFINEQQDDWASQLPAAEFVYNNSVHTSTKMTPFFAVMGKHPLLNNAPEDGRPEREVPAAIDRVKRMQNTRETLQANLKDALEYQQEYYNKKHQPQAFRKGDLVLLSTKYLSTKLPSKKLGDKFIGPFAVQDAVRTQAYRIRLPPSYRVHNVFHVSLLKPYHIREGTALPNIKALDLINTSEEVWEVEKILA